MINKKFFTMNARNAGKAAMCGILATAAVAAFSCKKDNNGTTPEPEPQPATQQPFVITVTNLYESDDVSNVDSVKVTVVSADSNEDGKLLASAKYDNGFALTLPAEAPEACLIPINLFVGDNAISSNPDAKMAYFFEIDAFKSNGNKTGSFKCSGDDRGSAMWIYVNADATVSGTMTTDHTYQVNLVLNKGWNTVYFFTPRVGDARRFTTEKPSESEARYLWVYKTSSDTDEDAMLPLVVNVTAFDGSADASNVDSVKVLIQRDINMPLASAKYDNGFTIILPAEVPTEYLRPVVDIMQVEGISISNSAAKILMINSVYGDFSSFDVNGNRVGEFWYHEASNGNVHYYYVDSAVTISGEASGVRFNLPLRRGWNIVYSAQNDVSLNQSIGTYSWIYHKIL